MRHAARQAAHIEGVSGRQPEMCGEIRLFVQIVCRNVFSSCTLLSPQSLQGLIKRLHVCLCVFPLCIFG